MSKELRSKLLLSKRARKARIEVLLSGVDRVPGALPLSAEDTVNLIDQHLHCKGSSQLPVLIIAAAYKTAKAALNRRVVKLTSHNDSEGRTDAFAEIYIMALGDDKAVTLCEMKKKVVQRDDIDLALERIANQKRHVENCLFITTRGAADDVREYARSKYDETNGVEIAILDCIGFLRHFLHLFHRLRKDFLDQYQVLVLQESDSAVSQPLKEAFLALRQASESAD